MPDKAPELYEKIQRLFEQKFQQDGVIQDLYQLILEGNADYKEARRVRHPNGGTSGTGV